MDRRHQQHRPFLGSLGWAGLTGLAALMAGEISAQVVRAQNSASPPAVPTPSETATPWVQASSPPPVSMPNAAQRPVPPAASPSPATSKAEKNGSPPANAEKAGPGPRPLVSPAPSDLPANTAPKAATTSGPGGPAQSQKGAPGPSLNGPTPKPAATPKPASTPPPGPAVSSAEEIKAKMLRERQREMNNAAAFEPAVLPDERQTFEENARMYNNLPPQEQGVIRRQAGERIREETATAYAQSGLDLNEDQREVFALRFRQERRRLEREIQEKANKERGRRLPQIIDQLRREFGRLTDPPAPSKPSGTPGGSLSTPATPESAPQGAGPAASPSAAANHHAARNEVQPRHS